MNQKQALRAANKYNKELEEHIETVTYQNLQYVLDVRAYVGCIQSMIKGGSPCEWCNDQVECQRPEKTASRGCEEWLLAFREDKPEKEPKKDGDEPGESERFLSASPDCGD